MSNQDEASLTVTKKERKCPKCSTVLESGRNELIRRLPFFNVDVRLAQRSIIQCPKCGYEDMLVQVQTVLRKGKNGDNHGQDDITLAETSHDGH